MQSESTVVVPSGPSDGASAQTSTLARVAARRRFWSLAAVLASTLGLGVSYGIGYTITTVQFQQWGAPGWLIGLGGSAPALAVVLLVPFAPRLAARLGTVRAMVAGAALVALSFALMPVLDGVGWWLVLRFVSGLGLTLPWLVGETWINTVSDDRTRGRVLATYTVLLFGGWAAGPVLLEWIGTGGILPFALGLAGIAAMVAPLIAARELAPELHRPEKFRPRTILRLAPLAMAAAFVGGIVEFGYISLLPVYATEAGASQTVALQLLSTLLVGGIVLQFGVGALADRMDRRRLLAALGLVLAVLTLGLAVTVDTPALAYVAAFALGGVVMAFYGVGLTILGEQVPRAQLVLANAGFLMAYEAGAIGGPLVSGLALDAWRPHGLAVVVVLVGAGFAVVAAVASVRSSRARSVTRSRPESAAGWVTLDG